MGLRTWAPGLLAVGLLALIYAGTLQRDVNGSAHDYLLDTGEIQVALNLWGTIHYTGYPHYTILSALLTGLGRGLGMGPATAASFTSLIWSGLTLLVFYRLLGRVLGDDYPLAAFTVLAVGLAETFWLHSIMAEVYSFSLLLVSVALLLGVQLHEQWQPGKWVWLMGVVGTAVAHHRILLFLLPVVLLMVWPQPWSQFRRRPAVLAYSLLAFLAPFAAYLYLPLRAWQGAQWVYGQPGNWAGLWQQFTGSEVTGALLRLSENAAGWLDNGRFLSGHLTQQFPGVFLLAGLVGLVWLVAHNWRLGLAFLAGTLILPLFIFLFPKAVWAPAVLMPALLCLAVGVAYGLRTVGGKRPFVRYAGWLGLAALALYLGISNRPFVTALTTDPAGREMITRLQGLAHPEQGADAPPTIALPWGSGFFAAAYGLYVSHELSGLVLVDHRADFAAILDDAGVILTPALYRDYWPPDWWAARVGEVSYSTAVPEIIAIHRPGLVEESPLDVDFALGNGIRIRSAQLATEALAGRVTLTVDWEAQQPISRDYSVAVHLLTQFPPQSPDDVVAQADAAHPVHGWFPTSRWAVGEVIRDVYVMAGAGEGTAVSPTAAPTTVAITMYHVDESGQFVNGEWLVLPLPAP